MSRRKIKLLVADDHTVVREGIKSCLGAYEHLQFVGEAGDGAEAVKKARKLAPDIVLMDINMPGVDGLKATELLRKHVPAAKVLILTVHSSAEYVRQILRSGARGYLLKDTSPRELVRAIEAVHAGEAFFSPEIAKLVLEDFAAPPALPLSPREREVLVLIAHGLANKEIAARLGVGVRTVETHREKIMNKLDLHSVAGLTKYAIAQRLVELP